MRAMGEWLAIGGLAAWLIATVLGQLPGRRWQEFRRRANFIGLLPFWGFFTSRLCAKDYHLCWRPVVDGEVTGDWREIGPHGPRPFGSAFWHPGRRLRKAQLDIAFALISFQSGDKIDPALLRRIPLYLALESFCRLHARAGGGTAFQFAVLASHGRESIRPWSVYFLSAIHEV